MRIINRMMVANDSLFFSLDARSPMCGYVSYMYARVQRSNRSTESFEGPAGDPLRISPLLWYLGAR